MSIDLELLGKGAQHLEDDRDFAFGAELTLPYDWTKEIVFDVPVIVKDQNGSYSCVAQSASAMATISYYKKTGKYLDFSARFFYSQISLGPKQGAYMRDGVDLLVKLGSCPRQNFVDDPQTEEHMMNKTGIEAVISVAKEYDIYSDQAYALVNGGIDAIAAAIRDHGSVMIGARGSNETWSNPYVAKGAGEWGHAIVGVSAVQKEGKKYIKFLNSWSENWGQQGYGYLSEEYINDGIMATFVLTDNFIKPLKVKTMEFAEKNEGKIVQDSEQTGAFGLIKDGKLLVADKGRVAELLATYIVTKEGKGVPADIWNELEKGQF